ncbi:GNAT family N-acetyltransferase [Actinosynnema pretiosum subsp. pretiosum]|uniref:GNAT family N-acetyltransferase n=1 Tax=Actinosynnema pretiosum subsp. pretiosum TaxID=103721 RepID=A0AA45R4N7_9PSEU|nr:Enhanced intracellular survival protein [Actinosynnema pretiosum subsp. pretiosum]QUF04969.1 GNAT family N-acetyltransferase [Actinosynnema pretiosum subsp. pretiosum]
MQTRATTEADLDAFVDTVHTAFGRFRDGETGDGGQWWSALEPDRGVLATDQDGRPVGTAASYSFELTLPGGGVLPVAGVTCVGVLPTHRRRGVGAALMRRQLTGVRERGEAVAVLLASEATIYGRFGYGPATVSRRFTVQRARATLAVPRAGVRVPTGSVRVLPRAQCAEVLEQVYDRYRRTRPGALSRPPRWWARGAGRPPVSRAPRHVAVHHDADGVADGYASYLLENDALVVDELVAENAAASAGLTGFALGHDLVDEVVFKHFPPDHPLPWQLEDPRAGQEGEATDWLWVRLLDVPAALAARGWSADGELVLDVTDPFLAERERHLLTVRDGRAGCTPTTRTPDLSLDVRDLGSLYLGGVAPSTLVRAGHVRAHHPEAAARADALFRVARAPHCVHWF